jgi:mitochondrial import receptor subunit TOM40
LSWPSLFSHHKNKLNLPSPGKFERLHYEATKGVTLFIYFAFITVYLPLPSII